ncbi:hypothetical protein SISSUDRAFT_1127941 [Sistotremastrum suecicum HHB10207 ss-3]|uniref:Uncharacterized protein n=1 Tax=Sistotremastrum suecicum HHB10207 ss-3 TaxID=1314776 RepID=A0A166EFZ9_9AGAM|nr:hypothetical protein SISSUDRAFT_1127941 [Sistotremastrum suecicum HHB10207 ss-3]
MVFYYEQMIPTLFLSQFAGILLACPASLQNVLATNALLDADPLARSHDPSSLRPWRRKFWRLGRWIDKFDFFFLSLPITLSVVLYFSNYENHAAIVGDLIVGLYVLGTLVSVTASELGLTRQIVSLDNEGLISFKTSWNSISWRTSITAILVFVPCALGTILLTLRHESAVLLLGSTALVYTINSRPKIWGGSMLGISIVGYTAVIISAFVLILSRRCASLHARPSSVQPTPAEELGSGFRDQIPDLYSTYMHHLSWFIPSLLSLIPGSLISFSYRLDYSFHQTQTLQLQLQRDRAIASRSSIITSLMIKPSTSSPSSPSSPTFITPSSTSPHGRSEIEITLLTRPSISFSKPYSTLLMTIFTLLLIALYTAFRFFNLRFQCWFFYPAVGMVLEGVGLYLGLMVFAKWRGGFGEVWRYREGRMQGVTSKLVSKKLSGSVRKEEVVDSSDGKCFSQTSYEKELEGSK